MKKNETPERTKGKKENFPVFLFKKNLINIEFTFAFFTLKQWFIR